MRYLNDAHLSTLGADWSALADVIEDAVRTADAGDYAQPLKPYLRYGDPRNRIIAMPAYLGGGDAAAGLKWIASFPGNRERGLPRAHGVIVLNRADTGQPMSILHGGLPNAWRTAAVSGVMLRRFLRARPHGSLTVGLIGWGPIGRAHFAMCMDLLGDRLQEIRLYDLAGVDPLAIPPAASKLARVVPSWEQSYDGCDVVITCTVAERRYIDRPPTPGSLLLDVSLRDYATDALRDVHAVVVDDWTEVCREDTDIERLHRECGLQQGGTRTLADVVCRDALAAFPPAESVLFCPMGMAIFDIAVARHLTRRAAASDVGIQLDP